MAEAASLVRRGRAWSFGNDISTDLIMPGAILWGHVKGADARKAAIMPNRPGWAGRDDPHPKFVPATMRSPGRTSRSAQPGRLGMIAALRASAPFTCPHRMAPGMIRSVLMSLPNDHARPRRTRLAVSAIARIQVRTGVGDAALDRRCRDGGR